MKNRHRRGFLRFAGPGLALLLLSAHVGTNDVTMVGDAGPYRVRVSIRLPGVIPGLADINVRVEEDDVRVLVTALRTIGGVGSAPPPDLATRVPGSPGLHTAQLWFMTRGPHDVIVTVEGGKGSGRLEIPVTATATQRLAMSRGLQLGLAAGGIFLILGLLTIVRVAARESVLEPGQSPGPRETRRSRVAMGVTAVVLAALLFGGWAWIRAEADLFNRRMDRPWAAAATVAPVADGLALELAITDSIWLMRDDPGWLARNNRARRADLIADHGKLMHMFVVGEPTPDAFGHVHPETRDGNTFTVMLPALDPGRYRIYADLSHEDGSARTLIASFEAPVAAPAAPAPDMTRSARDPDDAWWRATDEDDAGIRIRWLNRDEPLVAGTDVELAFEVAGPNAEPVALQPYMGMAGHLMLQREDGEVFIHAHPAGMIPMPGRGTMAPAMATMDHGPVSNTVRFPIVAPRAGRYRIWVQVRVGDRVTTRAFDTDIV